ncbi:mannan endo-1,4-beta-mannosidase-like protein [Medicago truncatula]|uniref:mannan endo-1,4-beta-mannosidase n=1 Tax=Medicago truncatula TaxID=3880 RepID=G7IBN9_MEDTR|nr:mannan endo-1,4-beta-mannosidase-like protein [Medicago truncatula]
MGFQILVWTFLVTLAVIQHGNTQKVNVGVGFVQRKGIHFLMNGKTHYVNGFNSHWLMIMAADLSTRPKVTSAFQQASQHGLNVGRTWAFNDGGYKALQISPGFYDETVFQGLDFVISEASKYGVKLILSLANNWNNFGGKNKYVQWAREHGHNIKNDDDFFTHPLVKQYYKNHVKVVLTRKNTISGVLVLYKDDPTIFAWELMNEPRVHDFGKSIQNWISEMVPYVKSLDGNHLLEIGLEGFYGETIDFISNTQIPEIDFATIHLYPDSWLRHSDEAAKGVFFDKWIGAHIQDANTILVKPIIVQEFGTFSRLPGYRTDQRDSYFNKIYSAISTSAISGGSCAGGIFWQLMSQGMDGYGDGYEVVLKNNPSTAEVIRQQSLKMSNIK